MIPLPRAIRTEIERLNGRTRTRWQPRRAHFINIFRVREPETLWFADGKLFLDGSNAAGKSALMALLVPPVFDLRLSSDRIDTAKSTSKLFGWHLTGALPLEEGQTERTGYVTLELISPSGQNVVIGYGARGVVGGDYKIWSFILDCPLEDIRFLDEEERPLGLRSMKAQVERLDGRFFDTKERSAYQEALNERFFQFSTPAEYLDFMKFLTEIRRPSLGQGLSVERVERFIMDSLPPVPQKVIESATHTYTEIISMRERARETAERFNLLSRWADAQYEVSEIHCIEAYEAWSKASREHIRARGALEEILATIERERAALERGESDVKALQERIAAREGEARSLHTRLESMKGVRSLLEDQKRLSENLREWSTQHTTRASAIEATRTRLANAEQELEQDREDLRRAEQRARDARISFINEYRRLPWPELIERLREMEEAPERPVELAAIMAESQRRSETLDRLQQTMAEMVRAKESLDAATVAKQKAAAELTQASENATKMRLVWRGAVEQYRDEVEIEVQRLPEMSGHILEIPTEDIPLTEGFRGVQVHVRTEVEQVVRPVQDAFEQSLAKLQIEQSEQATELARERARLNDLESQVEHTPPLSEAAAAARRALDAAGISALPLYAAVEPGPAMEFMAAVEESLLDSGLLDRLIVEEKNLAAARDILFSDGLAEVLLRPVPEAGGNLAEYLMPCQEAPLPRDAILQVLEGLPFTLAGSARRWGTPGQEGFVSGTHVEVEYLGARARAARRQRLIQEARAGIADLASRLERIVGELQQVQAQRSEFNQRWRQAVEHPSRLRILIGPWEQLSAAERELDGARRKEADAIEREQRASRKHLDVLGRYQAVRARENWLPPADTKQDVLTALRRQLERLPSSAERLESEQEGVLKCRDSVERARARHAGVQQDLETALAELEVVALRIRGIRSELEGVEQGLAEQMPDYDALQSDLESAENAARELRKRLLEQEKENSRTAQRIDTARADHPARQQDVLERERTDQEAHQKLLRYLRGIRHLEAQRALFEHEDLDGFHTEMRSLRTDGEEQQRLHVKNRAVEELRRAETEGRPRFLGLGPEYDSITYIPSFHDTESGEWVDIWDMTSRLGVLAESQREDMNNQMKRRVEDLLANQLYGAVSALVQQVEISERNLNGILKQIQLQRGIGNLQIRFLASTSHLDPKDQMSRTGGDMIAFFKAADWYLKPESAREVLTEVVRAEIETAHRQSLAGLTQQSFEEILAERLDYRRWFTTEVKRKEGDDLWVDLRSRHGEGSEGMKTMDLLQPMVACARLRLLGARRPDAPCIIAMDEVFAKLDDVHGTAILQILNGLQCDWILATEKGLHPNPVLEGAACYTVDWNEGHFQVFPAVWTGQRFVTLGDLRVEDLTWVDASESGQVRIALEDATMESPA